MGSTVARVAHLLDCCCWIRHESTHVNERTSHRNCKGLVATELGEAKKLTWLQSLRIGIKAIRQESVPNRHVIGILASTRAAQAAFKAHANRDPSLRTTCEAEWLSAGIALPCRLRSRADSRPYLQYDADLRPREQRQLQDTFCGPPYQVLILFLGCCCAAHDRLCFPVLRTSTKPWTELSHTVGKDLRGRSSV